MTAKSLEKSIVAVMKTGPETVVDDYGRLMRMAGYESFLPKESATNLKINMSWHLWYPACSTAPWQLEGVLKTLLDDGYRKGAIRLTQNRHVMFDDRIGEVNNGHTAVAERYEMEFTRLYEPPVNWVPYEPKAPMLVLDKAFGEEGLWIPDIFLDSNVIHLPTMKTHALTTISGAMKNGLDGLLQDHRYQIHGVVHETLVDLLAIQREIHSGMFVAMDGTLSGDGAGPRELMPFEKDFILASNDPVAIDAVAARMMGFDPMKIGYLRMAHERGLGCADIDGIELVGEDISRVNFHFHGRDETFLGRAERALHEGSLRPIEDALLRSPLASWTYSGSRIYNDYYWYPFRGRARVDDMAETNWGQLLMGYLPHGAGLESQGKRAGALIAVAAAAALLGMSAFSRISRLGRR